MKCTTEARERCIYAYTCDVGCEVKNDGDCADFIRAMARGDQGEAVGAFAQAEEAYLSEERAAIQGETALTETVKGVTVEELKCVLAHCSLTLGCKGCPLFDDDGCGTHMEEQKDKPVNEFIIEGRLPSLNDYTRACRSHWSKGAKFKREVETPIIWCIKAALNAGTLRPVEGRIALHIEWHERDKRRDVDNIASAKKFILDAMQRAGIIKNDSREFVAGVYDEVIDDKRDFVRVMLHEL